MKKLIAILLVCALLAGCAPHDSSNEPTLPSETEGNQVVLTPEAMPEFSDLGDPALLTYIEDTV